MNTPSFLAFLRRPLLWPGLTVLLIALAGAGCGSLGNTSPGSFASVTIYNHSIDEIKEMTIRAFKEKGYAPGAPASEMLVFERNASGLTTVARDGLVAADAGARTVDRVKVQWNDVDSGGWRVYCQAYLVSGAGDSFFEEEHRLGNMRSRPYQEILDDVLKRLLK